MMTSLRQAAGSLLVVGLAGTEITALERAWLKLVRPGGIILFKRNIADARQARMLLGEATALGAENGFRCVDVEGGTVNRLRDALGVLPSAQAVARAGQTLGKTRIECGVRRPCARKKAQERGTGLYSGAGAGATESVLAREHGGAGGAGGEGVRV